MSIQRMIDGLLKYSRSTTSGGTGRGILDGLGWPILNARVKFLLGEQQLDIGRVLKADQCPAPRQCPRNVVPAASPG